MATSKFNEWIKIMEDPNILKLLFYLKSFNPDVTVDDLQNNLGFKREKIIDDIHTLKSLGIIIQENGKFKLSPEGKSVVNDFYDNIGEHIP